MTIATPSILENGWAGLAIGYLYDPGPDLLGWYRDNQSKLRQKIMSLQNHPG